jgi:hypothetical protein
MYIITATIKPSNPKRPEDKYKKTIYEGVYLPKDDEKKVRHEKIKAEFDNKVISILKDKNPSLEFDYTLKIEHNAMDFVLKSEE